MTQAPPDPTTTKLQAALDSLDLDLEVELQRYYRQRPVPSPEVAALSPELTLAATVPPSSQEPSTAPADTSLSPWQQSPPPPEDYLESSEELLKSLDLDNQSEPPKVQASRWKWILGLVGAGILGGGLVILAIATPDLFTRKSTPDTATVPTPSPESATPAAVTSAPSTVNLASQEFIELSLENLSTIDPSALPEVGENGALPNASTPGVTPSINPQNATATPLPPPLAGFPGAIGTPLATPDGLKVGYYYVISRNTTPTAVEKAKTVVKGASVRQFPVGQAIQLGEVDTEAKAQALVSQLKAQNITAEVYFHQLSPAL